MFTNEERLRKRSSNKPSQYLSNLSPTWSAIDSRIPLSLF